MGREIRRVAAGWEHPKDDRGRFVPLMGRSYTKARDEFMAMVGADGLQAALDEHGSAPNIDDYMPEIAPGTPTLLAMYEDTSEGTPISPPFATPEEVARWCADNGASIFGGDTATYDEWLRIARGAWTIGVFTVADGLTTEIGPVPEVSP